MTLYFARAKARARASATSRREARATVEPPPGVKDMRIVRWCLRRGHVIRDCRDKAAGKPKATKSVGALDRGLAVEAAGDWVEDRPSGSLMRECGALDDDWGLDRGELAGQDWIPEDELDKDDNDDQYKLVISQKYQEGKSAAIP